MSLFRLDTSIRTEGSVSRQVADVAEAEWLTTHPQGQVVRRDLGTSPLSTETWVAAASAGWTPVDALTDAQRDAQRLAAQLVDELAQAEAYVFALPLYNFGAPASFKTWVDFVIADPRMGPRAPEQLLAGRPALLVLVRGGGYGEGTPRAGWDHATPYAQRILADVFGLALKVSEVELTLADVNPAMASLRDVAAASLQSGRASAADHGRAIAQHVLASRAA